MFEQHAIRFGPEDRLSGVLTVPENGLDSKSPLAILPNAGSVHRVGPFRIGVQIANALASCVNAASLRMDLSGLGDSRAIAKPSSSPGEPNTPRGVFDLSAAMDHLRDRYEINQFVPIGLCSGALHTHLMAERSDQVVGAVMIDGIAFRTTGFYLRHYLFRMLFPSFWYGAIQRRRLDALPPSNPETNPAEFFYSESIGRETASQQIRQMKRDGKRLMFVFTGGCDDVNSAAQFRSMFGVSPDQR
ncbi:MAG: hypothetical protein AAFP90_10785, partial [Planctomycetota bacterium]